MKNAFPFILVALFGAESAMLAPATQPAATTVDSLRTAQSRIFDGGSVDIILKAFRISLMKEGHIVRTYDPKKGVLVAALRGGKPTATWKDWISFLGRDKTARIELAVQAKLRGAKNVETRVSLQKITRDNLGRLRGNEITDERPYSSLYVLVNTILGSTDEPEEDATESTRDVAEH